MILDKVYFFWAGAWEELASAMWFDSRQICTAYWLLLTTLTWDHKANILLELTLYNELLLFHHYIRYLNFCPQSTCKPKVSFYNKM